MHHIRRQLRQGLQDEAAPLHPGVGQLQGALCRDPIPEQRRASERKRKRRDRKAKKSKAKKDPSGGKGGKLDIRA